MSTNKRLTKYQVEGLPGTLEEVQEVCCPIEAMHIQHEQLEHWYWQDLHGCMIRS